MFYARLDRDKFFVKLLKKVPELDFRRLGHVFLCGDKGKFARNHNMTTKAFLGWFSLQQIPNCLSNHISVLTF